MIEINILATARQYIQQIDCKHLHLFRRSLILAFIVLLIIQPSKAVTVDVTVKGLVIAKPICVINANQDINVSFGELKIVDIDGINYGKKEIPYTVTCSGNTEGVNGLMKAKLQGTSSNFDVGLLSTNTNDLAIKILNEDNQQLKINEWLNFNYPNIPKLYAVAVKNSGATLRGGDFSSSATLLVDIQ